MQANIELAKTSLKAAKSGWYFYLSTFWLLILVLYIDLITEQQFIQDKADISFFDLEVPRVAFSFTYSALFGVFAFWAAASAESTREIICSLSEKTLLSTLIATPECQLWGLSPFHRNTINRHAFWLLSSGGLVLLLIVTVIHLGKYNVPESMGTIVYQRIGIFSGTILVLSLFLAYKRIYPAWSNIRDLFVENQAR